MTETPRRLAPVRDEPLHDLTLPHDLDAERAILGACLISPDAIDTASQLVTPESFYDRRHEIIYAAIERRYATLQTVDQTVICDDLRAQLPKLGGQAFVYSLVMAPGALAGNTHSHASIVARLATKRRLAKAHMRGLQRALNPADADATPEELLDAALDDLAEIPTTVPGIELGTKASTWAPQDLAAIIEHGEQLEQPTVLRRTDGQALLYPAAVHSISGEPESGKTWVALIAAAQTLRDTGEHVTYVDFEDRAGRVIPRLIHLGAPERAILERFHYIRPTDALDPAGRKHLDAWADRSVLSVIDGVTEAMTMHGLSLLDNEDAAKYLDLLPRHLADFGAAVLQIDHVVKDAEARGRYAVGAQHKLAGLDGAAYGVKVMQPFGRGKIGRAALSIHKDRPGAIREVALGNAIGQLVIDSQGESMAAYLEQPSEMPKSAQGDDRPTHLMEKVSRYVEGSPGASRTQIEIGVTGKAPWVRKAIDALVAEGYLAITLGPRGAQAHSVIAVYREADDVAS